MPVFFPSIQASLAGVLRPTGIPGIGWDWRRSLLAFVAPQQAPSLSGVSLTYHVAGFEPTTVKVAVPAIATNELAERTFVVTPTAAGFGAVRLHLDSPLSFPGELVSSLFTAPSQVELLSPTNDGVVYSTQLDNAGNGVTELGGIPFGEYRLVVSLNNGAWRHPPQGHRVIVSQQVAEVTIPTADLGAVLLVPEHHDFASRSLAYRIVTRRRGGNPKWAQFAFRSPPYLLQGLTAGTYDLEVFAVSRTGDEFSTAVGPVEVRPAEMSERRFSWNE